MIGQSKPRVGVWLVGAKGGVASTAIVGLLALQKNLIGSAGLVTQLPQFQAIGLADWADFVIAGHEIRSTPLPQEAMRLATESRTTTVEVIEQCRAELEAIDRRIRPGTLFNVGPTIASLADFSLPSNESPRQIVARLAKDMTAFVESERLEHLVVVNVSSTEPKVDTALLPSTWAELEPRLDQPESCPLPASSLYAIAALENGYSYINFTPSLGSSPAAINDLAVLRKSRHYGCDGKTGETLMKSVLAPMFARRNLQVMSWVGHNIFGNMDGQVLDDPVNKKNKVTSKDHLLGEILGYRPKTLVSIEYIPDMGDWKTAWDHIHFAGFLGAPMTLQFTWQGCDSVLAAPLVLDLVRFTELAWRRNHVGLMTFLASFFKSPYGVDEHCFDRQYQVLEQWAAQSVTANKPAS
jgi:myo-inositol-1-phosphate synthase